MPRRPSIAAASGIGLAPQGAKAIIREQQSPPDSVAVALQALAFVLGDAVRRDRFMALTGLDADGLRARLADPAVLAAALEFLANHETDLVAAAQALDMRPEQLAHAWETLR